MDNPGDNIGRGRLLGHLAADGREFLSVAVAEPDSLIGGVIVDANDDLYIAYTYDRGLSGQEKTVVQKLDQQGHVLWEFRFDAAGMRVNRKALANSGHNTFLLAYEQDQEGTAYPGLAEFTYDGQLVWMKTIDRPGWDVTFAGLSSTADMVYVGLNNQADQQQSKVMAVQTDLPLIVTVNNVAPAVEIHGASASVSRGTPVSLTAAVTDPGTQDTYTYVWSVTRDGQPYPIEGPADQPGFAFIPVDGGIYQVALMVADDDGGVAMDTATFDVADAVPVEIIVGDHRLLPNRANQEITIVATGVTDVTGLNLRAQLGDGGGLLPEPVFGGVEFGGGIWDSHPYTVMGGAVGGLEQFLQASVAFNETGRSVPAGGVIVTLLVDTTGFFEGQFDLRLAGTEIGADTAFVLAGGVELPVSIRNGSVTIAAAEVVGVYAFYNNSPFDGHDPASNANDDRAIATDKHPLRPGQTATFANYTSYVRGLNGMMVDIAGLPAGGLDAASFEFRVGNTQDPSDWPFGPTPEGITVRRGAGVGGSDRVTLIWPDSAIVGCWLQVTVGPTMETGLALPYVFYFGNAPGESGNSRTDTFVDAVDFVGVRDHPRDFLHPATTDVVFDFNRDGLVDGTDLAIVRDHPTNFVTALKLVDFRVHTVSSSEPLPGSSVSIAAMFDVTSGGPLSAPTLTVQGLVSTPVPPRALVDAWDAPPTILSQAAAEVIPSWRNPAQATDVTGDGQVTVLDALSIIRHLEAQAFPRLPDAPAKPHPYVDVNGDGLCTPLDVLWVINSIPARTPGLPEGEARPEGAPVARSERLPTISLGPTPTSDRLPRLSPPESDVRPANRSVTSLVGQIPVKVLDVRPSKLSHAAALPVPVAHRDRDEPTPRFIDSADWELDAVLEEVAPDVARVLSGQT
jgi:hypothetical protein